MTALSFYRRNARWLAAGFLLTFASSFGQTFFIALFAEDVRAASALSHGEFGAIYTAATLGSALVMIWLGKTADSVRPHVLAAMVLAALAATSILMSQAAGIVTLFVALFALRLFGQGMTGHVASTAMARWFAAARGRALAVTGLGRAAGEAALPSLVVAFAALWGWREAWLAVAGLVALVILPAVAALLARPPGDADGENGASAGQQARRIAPRDWTRPEVARDPLFYALLLGVVAPPFILTGVFFHQAHIVAVKGWDIADYAAAFPGFAAGSVGFALLTGWAIDRWGATRLLAVTLVPLAVGLVVLAAGKAPSAILAFMVLSGASNGASGTFATALWAELYGTRHIGAIRSLALAGVVASTAIAPGATGVLIDRGVGIEAQLYAAAGYTAAVIAMFVVLRLALPRLRGRPAEPTATA